MAEHLNRHLGCVGVPLLKLPVPVAPVRVVRAKGRFSIGRTPHIIAHGVGGLQHVCGMVAIVVRLPAMLPYERALKYIIGTYI